MEGLYKIKDLEVLSGIKAHTIRIWEKRYGLLAPERTDTGIRVYDNQNLVKLLNVVVLNDAGLKISKIAKLSQEEIQDKIEEVYSQYHACSIDASLLIKSMIQLKCRDFDRTLSDIIKTKGLETAYRNCLSSFLQRIDELGDKEKITAVQKHFVYNLIRQKIIVETNHLPVLDNKGFDAILFTPEGQPLEFHLLFYNYMLQKKKFNTLYLGVNLPTEDLKKALKETKPKRIVVSMRDDKEGKIYLNYVKELRKSTDLPIYVCEFLIKNYGTSTTKDVFSIRELID